MPEQPQPEPPRPAARRSRKLPIAVIILAILPLILPFSIVGLAQLRIGPLDNVANWDSLAGFLLLGPSILVAAASILLGCIGLFYSHRRPTSPKNMALFWMSVICGSAWSILFILAWLLIISFADMVGTRCWSHGCAFSG